MIRVSVKTIAFGLIALNDQKHPARSLVARHSGWLCASLAAATGLYTFCGPSSTLDAAGVPAESSVEDGAPAERVKVDQLTASAENERIQKALFETDPAAAPTPAVRRVGLWSSKKKPATSTAATKPNPLSKLWGSAGKGAADPFAEADRAAQEEVLARQAPVSPTISAESGFTKAASKRRRLLEYQAETTAVESRVTVDEVPADTATLPTTQPAAQTARPASGAIAPVAQPNSESELRSLFETEIVAAEPAARSTIRTKSGKGAESPSNRDLEAVGTKIQQVSEADAAELPVAEPATPVSGETVNLSTEQVESQGRAEATRQLQQTADHEGLPEEPASPTTSASSTTQPAATAADSEIDPFAEPLPATALPSPQPDLKAETELPLPAKSEFEEVAGGAPTDTKSEQPSVVRPVPAMIPGPATASEMMQSGAPAEPAVRTSTPPVLPPLQVLANRPMELPAPEGWTAAVKLNARRAARLAALTGQSPETTDEIKIRPAQPGQRSVVQRNDADSRGYDAQPQGYRAPSPQQPVVLDQIEGDGVVRQLSADDSNESMLRDAHHTEESASVTPEPAKIREPIVVAEYAAPGQSAWPWRVITALSVLFGLYGFWCCRTRALEAE